MKQAKTNKDKTVDSTKTHLILREFEADGNSHLPTERSSFSMSQLQNLAVDRAAPPARATLKQFTSERVTLYS